MTKTLFAVLERNFEYNDEGYDVGEGGNVVRAFTTLQAAEAHALKCSVARLKHSAELLAGSHIGDVFTEEAAKFLYENGLDEDNYIPHDTHMFSTLSDEDLETLCLNINDYYKFFFVQSVEVEE